MVQHYYSSEQKHIKGRYSAESYEPDHSMFKVERLCLCREGPPNYARFQENIRTYFQLKEECSQ